MKKTDSNWIQIPEFPNYSINQFGQIKNINRNSIIKQQYSTGFPSVRMSKNGISYSRFVIPILFKLHKIETPPIYYNQKNKFEKMATNLKIFKNGKSS